MNYIKCLSILFSFLLLNTCHSMMDSDLIQTNYNKDNLDSSKTSEVYNLLELRKKAFQASSGQYVAINDKDKELFNMIKKQIHLDAVSRQINSDTTSAQIKPCMTKYILNNNKNSMVPMSNIHSIKTSSIMNNTENSSITNVNKYYIYA